MPETRGRLFLIYSINQGMHWFSMGIVIPVMILALMDFGFNIGQIGTAMAVMGTTVLLLELPTGGFADTLGRKRVYQLAVLFYIAGYSLILITSNFAMLLVDLCLIGIGRALSSGSIDAWFIDGHKGLGCSEEELQADLAKAGVVIPVALGAGTLIGGFLPDIFGGFRMNIIVLVCLYALQVILTSMLIKEDRTAFNGRISDGIKQFPSVLGDAVHYGLGHKNTLAVLAATAALGIGLSAMEQLWQPKVSSISGNTGTWLLGVISAGYFCAAAAGNAISTPLLKLFGHRYRLLLFCFRLVMAVLYVCLAFSFSIAIFIPFYFLMFFSHGITGSPEMTVYNRGIPSNKRSSLLSLNSLFLQAGGALGSLLAGQIALHFSISSAWTVTGVLLGISAFAYLFIRDNVDENTI